MEHDVVKPRHFRRRQRSVDAAALLEMERKGLIRRGTGRLDREILETDPLGKPCGVMEALIGQRAAR